MSPPDTRPAPDAEAPHQPASFPIVGVGASAGGLEAFTQLLKALPPDTGLAFVLVQHLAPTRESALAEILARATRMPVTEVTDQPVVEPDHVYVIPPGRDMVISQGRLQLLPRDGARGAHHPIDGFFRSLAEDSGHLAVGVVLSGTANDGTLGLEAIKAEGGLTFAQDATAQYEGMPHSAVASGCVDMVLAPAQIAQELARMARHPFARAEASAGAGPGGGARLARVLQQLHRSTGVDFSQYKFNTLSRRITRRMLLQRLEDLDAYAEFLQANPDEVQALYDDILIGVTSFFRNPESFEVLKTKVFPRLMEHRGRHDAVRIWTLGCSTGQEAYSVAMAFTEFVESRGIPPDQVQLQVFATDLSERGVDTARAGIYPKDIAQDVSPERLRRFFVEIDGHYRIAKKIRDACVFSHHNVLADPPFSRLDLITCRNLLIYLESALQQKVVPTLHYALKPTGCLWLGSSETVGGFRNLFEPLDARHKIYLRRPGPHGASVPVSAGATPRATFVPVAARSGGPVPELHREADRLLLTRCAPPSVLVSAELDILQYRGDTSPYLAPAPGKASLNLAKMLREGLLVGVRAAAQRAGKTGQAVREEGLRVRSHDGWRDVAIEVVPVKGSDTLDGSAKDGGLLVLFDESGGQPLASSEPSAPPRREAPELDADPDKARIARELAATREYLQSVIEQHESANEELQSSNEEIQSANEELQSINEELETSKEEIQSSNEELATVNDELNSRNSELNRLNNDLVNVFASVQVPIVLVGADLRVRRFTPAAEKMMHLLPGDIGRPLAHIKLGLVGLPELEPLLVEVLDTVSTREIEVHDPEGQRYLLRLRPYRTLDNRIDGVVLMLVDVEGLRRAHDYTESIVETVHEPLLVLDGNLRVRTASRSFYRDFKASPEATEGRHIFELGNGQWNIPELRQRLEQVLPRDSQFSDFEVKHEFEGLGLRTMRLNARRLQQRSGRSPAILLAIEDVTGRLQAQAVQAQLAAIVASSQDAVIGKTLDSIITSWNQGAEKIFGYSAAEAIGQSMRMLLPEGGLDEERSIIERIRQGITVEHYETVRRRKDGSRVDVSIAVSPLRDGEDRVVGASQVARDTTERRRSEAALLESEERFRTLAENMPLFAWTADADGHIYWYNRRWYDYTGLTREESMGEGWRRVHHPDHLERVVAGILQSLATGSTWEDTFPLRAHDGSYRWFLSRSVPIRDSSGRVVRWSGTNTDITEQRELAEELRRSVAELSEVDRRKNEFLAMLAHELRNPLAPIRNSVQILRLSHPDEASQAAAQIMERQVAHMVRLVEDLLDVSRVSRGRIELRSAPVDLGELLQQVVDTVRPAYLAKGLSLQLALPQEPLVLLADAVRLAQVVGNLLNNAIKFTPAGGHIALGAVREGSEAVVRVRDSGMGITPEQLPHIFDMFVQGDTSLERGGGGLGIGLTLVKNLVALHGGTVQAASDGPGQGSEFVLRLPLADDARLPEPPVALASASASTTARRVLVVDDNRDAAESLAVLLQLSGHDAQVAHDGLEAVATAAAFRPELVLLDIGLPKLNGYDAARRMRGQPGGLDMVLVALTGWGQPEDRQKSSDAGFDAHLVKPVDPAQLASLLAGLPGNGEGAPKTRSG